MEVVAREILETALEAEEDEVQAVDGEVPVGADGAPADADGAPADDAEVQADDVAGAPADDAEAQVSSDREIQVVSLRKPMMQEPMAVVVKAEAEAEAETRIRNDAAEEVAPPHKLITKLNCHKSAGINILLERILCWQWSAFHAGTALL